MFKLLDNKWRNLIINELQEHIGKYKSNPEVLYRNIYIGTEIEFNWIDDITKELQIITGVVEEIDEVPAQRSAVYVLVADGRANGPTPRCQMSAPPLMMAFLPACVER